MGVTCIVTYRNGDEEYYDINYPFYNVSENNGWLYIIGFDKIRGVIRYTACHMEEDYVANQKNPHLIAKIRMKSIRGYRFE